MTNVIIPGDTVAGKGVGSKGTILCADDNEDALFVLETALIQEGFHVVSVPRGDLIVAAAQKHLPDLCIFDVMMPGLDGYQATKLCKDDPVLRYIPIILLTSKDSEEERVYGFSQGADDYLGKPFEKGELLARIYAALRTRALYRELQTTRTQNEHLAKALQEKTSFSNIIGKSSSMQEVFRIVEKVAPSEVPILIRGESGTGKELIAHAIHAKSDRATQALVIQNCAALSENLLESELFGHVKGAFTGAVKDKRGLFEEADGGTLFLDELGEMSLPLQAKLLRVLQDGTFTPVGDTKPRKVDVRLVAATHRDLPAMIQEGTFREDLYYRINVITVHLPPLRERKEDLPLLVAKFVERRALSLAEKKGYPKERVIPSETMKRLLEYHWPGNIRQLENEIERLLLLAGEEKELSAEFLSSEVRWGGVKEIPRETSSLLGTPKKSEPQTLPEKLAGVERTLIEEALRVCGGNKSEAARTLGISRSNLIGKVKEYGLQDE